MVFEMAWFIFNGMKRDRIYCDYDMLLATQEVRVRELSETNKTVVLSLGDFVNYSNQQAGR